jgi:putative ABC transport system substrate-binding protein
MRRRNFIKGIVGSAVAWPLPARAQQPAMLGFIHNASQSYFAPFATSFRDGLKEAGYVEGRNVAIEYRWAEGHSDRLPALVADLLDRHVAAIFTGGGPDPAKAAKAATTKIPIVFVSAADPVTTGLVTSLGRPGGNVTGISLIAAYLNAKKLALLLDLMPTASAIGALVDPTYSEATSQSEEFRAAAGRRGVRPILLSASTESDVNTAFATLVQEHADGLVLSNGPLFATLRDRLVALAAQHSIPTIYFQREFVLDGGLMSYGPSFFDAYYQAGIYTGRILKGERPADLPVLQPTKFEFFINLKTAKKLGVKISDNLLSLADEVIE